MAYHGYVVTYSIRWQGKKSSYIYQRFFRAIYGYKQVVSKANGRRYVYHRPGVLSNCPFIKAGKTTVIIPDTALQPLLNFLKTGKNPAHRFSFVSSWSEIIKYSIAETYVEPETAADAVYNALERIRVQLIGGSTSAKDLLDRVDALAPDALYSLYYAIKCVIGSSWFSAFQEKYPNIAARVQRLQSLIS